MVNNKIQISINKNFIDLENIKSSQNKNIVGDYYEYYIHLI